jgi:hypothetical protein
MEPFGADLMIVAPVTVACVGGTQTNTTTVGPDHDGDYAEDD